MSTTFKAGPKGQVWDSFIFIADYRKAEKDWAMIIAKIEYDLFDLGSEKFVTDWDSAAQVIRNVCDKHKSKVAELRIVSHGNVEHFSLGSTLFSVRNAKTWTPKVEAVAKYFIPGVSFVTIDACLTGRDEKLLSLFSRALGGVDVRGYRQLQTDNSSSEDGRGRFVTCRMDVCTRGGKWRPGP